ncbi:IS66 family insertion sequence element accessory protein TnpB [Schleiferilactobacillus shenzhenensis]|uniref:Transposase n=1 Tax=Schleiferilactobacillus shenzhenensis LY-73 TaxID=1231336 RepID=U4TSM1_9LACO|nr:IS66 family insertion sequence element accessory protein TnpB [Schleiferilactobacillus shenzhenensis]ERL64863.1 hypothetical protein L248_0467 [Schleiferilactobacillus shenzhenensis LY-73]
MLPDLTSAKIFIVCGRTDLRKGIDGLAALIQSEYDLDVFDHSLFLFCGTRSDRFKALYWDGDGFLLLYERFENGHLQWPHNQTEVKRLRYQQLERLLSGLAIEERRTLRPAKPGIIH